VRLLNMRLAVGAWYLLWRLETYEHQDGVGCYDELLQHRSAAMRGASGATRYCEKEQNYARILCW
jgi:hypothetical protein